MGAWGELAFDNDTANEEEKTDDVLAAMKWLSTQPGVDPKRIGLLGHSEGGVLAAMAASRATEPAAAFGVLVLAGLVKACSGGDDPSATKAKPSPSASSPVRSPSRAVAARTRPR